MVTEALHPGLVAVDRVHNVRHMGNCRTSEGGSFCSDIFRSASLSGLSEEGCTHLVELGVRTVVDLRSDLELDKTPTRDLAAHGIGVVHAPVVQYDGSPLNMENFRGYAARYRELLDLGREAYKTLFETIAGSEGGVLFHCSAGKDRTGVAAALLLELAGVSDEQIIDDYAHSFELLAPVREEWRPRFEEQGLSDEDAQRIMASNASDIAETLTYIRKRWGSAEDYMLDLGMDEETIAALKRRLTAAD